MKTSTYLFAFFILIIQSCKKDWLNEKPSQNLAVPTTLQDCQALLDNAFIINQNSNVLGETASDDYYVLSSTYNSFRDFEKMHIHLQTHTIILP